MSILQVIKYEGDNSTFVWKHPSEDFNTHSQLIVHESQEALFLLNGQPLDLFGPGRYTLETANIPLLRHIINIPTGGVSAFHCEVYFINKVEQMAIQWGTDSKIQYIEPNYGFPIAVGAGGEMSLRAEDSRKLLVKLVGTENCLSRERLMSYFRSLLMTRVKTYIAQVLKTSRISIFEVDEYLNVISDALKWNLMPDFSEYGISLEKFFVTRFVKPDGDPQFEKFKDLHFRQYADIAEAKLRQQIGVIDKETDAQKILIESQAVAKKRQIEGYSYQQERGFDVAESMAQNTGVGNYSTTSIGLGIMAGISNTVGNKFGEIFKDTSSEINTYESGKAPCIYCDNCGAKLIPGMKYCDECGQKIPTVDSCSACGYIFERKGKFCPKCGTKREN